MGILGHGGIMAGGGGLLTNGRHIAIASRSKSIAGSNGTESRVWEQLFEIHGCSFMTASAFEMHVWEKRGIKISRKLYTSDPNAGTLQQGDRVSVDGVLYNVINPSDMGDRGRAFQVLLERPESE